MARLADDVIEKIKQGISLSRLIEQQGYQLKKHGKDLVMPCPFHDDDTPSLVVSPDTNLWHCMGACQKGGSIIDWVMQTKGLSFRNACEILLNDISLIADNKVTKARGTTQKLPSPFDVQGSTSAEGGRKPGAAAADANDQQALKQVIDYYHDCLKQSPEALEYLDKRGLNHPELIKAFKLGYANRTLAYRLPEKNRKAGAEIRGKLQSIGILRNTGHEHFNGSLVVPVINGDNQITEVYGRKIGGQLRKGTALHLYLPGPHQGVWNASGLLGLCVAPGVLPPATLEHPCSSELILCESIIDAMTFWVHGFKNVTCSYGTSGFTNEHLELFKKCHIKRVLIAYDRDEAGNQAANDLAKKLTAEGIDCFRILFPKGMDANEYALQMQPAPKALGLVIRKAEWLGKGNAPSVTTEMVNTETGEIISDEVEQYIPSLAAEEVPEPPATPMPRMAQTIDAEITDNEINIPFGDRQYRVRGLNQNSNYDQLKIQLMVSHNDQFHLDKLDLYSSKQRTVFINQASTELCLKHDIIKKDLSRVLLKLEQIQDEQRQQKAPVEQLKTLTSDEQQQALALLKSENLLQRILTDFNQAGVVGEESNKLVGYLACVSRKLDRPLAVMIQSSSAAGKSSLMDAILNLMPTDERIQYSAMTGQSLFYMGETNLKHKILAIAEEEGASNASYALKLLQSEGEVTIASTGKDDSTGNLITKEYKVEGPVMLFMTTTAIDLDEELMNRCLVLSVDEGRQQTQAIHQAQRQKRTLEGLAAKVEKSHIITLHQNAQRLIKPLHVINPYADQLTFLDDKTRTRRDHEKYLTLIDSIALLHQHQREIKKVNVSDQNLEYIEVTLEDIKAANQLAHDVLGRTLDELPPQTRKLLTIIENMVNQQCEQQKISQSHYRFSRRTVRAACGWSYTQVRVHLDRLVELEYLIVHRGGRGQSFEYELLYQNEGQQGEAFMMGLLNVNEIKNTNTTQSSRGNKQGLTGSKRPHHGGVSESEKTPQANVHQGYGKTSRSYTENALQAV